MKFSGLDVDDVLAGFQQALGQCATDAVGALEAQTRSGQVRGVGPHRGIADPVGGEPT